MFGMKSKTARTVVGGEKRPCQTFRADCIRIGNSLGCRRTFVRSGGERNRRAGDAEPAAAEPGSVGCRPCPGLQTAGAVYGLSGRLCEGIPAAKSLPFRGTSFNRKSQNRGKCSLVNVEPEGF